MSNIIYSHGVPVPRVDDDRLYFLNRLTILYGPSGSGKSSLIQHILNSLKDTIPLAIVACPTASLNGDYQNIIPDQCIYEDVTKPLMQKIFQRQSNVMAMYELVRNVDHLKQLHVLTADNDSFAKIEKLSSIYRKGCADIKSSYDDEDAETAVSELTTKYHKKMVKIMRASINLNIRRVQSFELSDTQKAIISNFNINPSILLLIDDCMASIKEWKDMEETKKLFYQGRHYSVTTLLTAQNETLIPPQLRSNAHISIFTTQTIVNTFINKASSGISPDEKKMISKIAETIFAQSDDRARPNYKKLVIFGQIIKTEHKVQYIIGTIKKKKFGSAAMWELCNQVRREQPSSLTSNSFSKMFALKPKPTIEQI